MLDRRFAQGLSEAQTMALHHFHRGTVPSVRVCSIEDSRWASSVRKELAEFQSRGPIGAHTPSWEREYRPAGVSAVANPRPGFPVARGVRI